MIGGDQGDIGSEVGRDPASRLFAHRINCKNKLSLANFKKLFAEVSDYHSLYYSIFPHPCPLSICKGEGWMSEKSRGFPPHPRPLFICRMERGGRLRRPG